MSANRLPEPKKPEGRIQAPAQVEYFYPREHAILAEYFEDKKKLPKEARKIDPYEIIPYETEYDESAEGIICREGRGGRDGYEAICNAVARIALAPIRDGLPVWEPMRTGRFVIRGSATSRETCRCADTGATRCSPLPSIGRTRVLAAVGP